MSILFNKMSYYVALCRFMSYQNVSIKRGHIYNYRLTCPPDIGIGNMLEFSWTKREGYGQETIHSRTDYQHAS